MKIIVRILIGIAVLVALVLFVALFIKKDYSVEKQVAINIPKQQVFEYIRHVKYQSQYSVWVMKDQNSKKTYNGTDGEVGYIYTWDGNKEVGKGEQEIINIVEGEKVSFQLRFIKPFEGIAESNMLTESITPNQTKVKWNFKSKMAYPMNIMLLFMNMDTMIGKDLQTSLMNLKQALEK